MDKSKKVETKEERLLRHIKTTYQARYVANRRLLNKARLQNTTAIVNSVLVTVASTLSLSSMIENKDFLNCLLVAFSIISLALSISLGSHNNQLVASEFHSCGRELQGLYEKLISKSKIDYEKASSQYNEILNKYPTNHDLIDYEFLKYEDECFWNAIPFKVKYFFSEYFLYLFLMIAPALFGIILYIKTK